MIVTEPPCRTHTNPLLSFWVWWPPGPRPKQNELYPRRAWLAEAALFATGVELLAATKKDVIFVGDRLERHARREDHWLIVHGVGRVTLEGEQFDALRTR